MDAVGEPDDRRQAFGEAARARPGRAPPGRPGAAARGGSRRAAPGSPASSSGEQLQRPALVGPPVLPHRHPVGGGVERLEVGEDAVPVGEAGAQRVAEERVGPGHRGSSAGSSSARPAESGARRPAAGPVRAGCLGRAGRGGAARPAGPRQHGTDREQREPAQACTSTIPMSPVAQARRPRMRRGTSIPGAAWARSVRRRRGSPTRC